MKVQIWKADQFGYEVVGGPGRFRDNFNVLDLFPGEESLQVYEVLVALVHVEEGDSQKEVDDLCRELKKLSKKMELRRVVVSAFGHLSSSFAPPTEAIRLVGMAVETCRSWENFEVFTSPFGWGKTFELRASDPVYGVMFRSFPRTGN